MASLPLAAAAAQPHGHRPPPPRPARALTRPRRPLPPPPSAFDFDGPAFSALERAVTLVNKVIPSGGGGGGEGKGGDPATATASAGDGAEAATAGPTTKKERWLTFSATASASVPAPSHPPAKPVAGTVVGAPLAPVAAVGGEAPTPTTPADPAAPPVLPGRTLAAYLALPVDQYSLLDPAWVTRVDVAEGGGEEGGGAGAGGHGPAPPPSGPLAASATGDDGGAFVVSIPLAGMLGIPATPSMRVRVVRREAGLVGFALDEAALGMPAADAAFSAAAEATLQAGDGRRGWKDRLGLGRRGRAHIAHHHKAAAGGGGPPPPPPPPPSLAATVSFSARVRLPAAAAPVPTAVLRPAAKLIARAVLTAALPAFLSGIAADYGTWAVGAERRGVGRVVGGGSSGGSAADEG